MKRTLIKEFPDFDFMKFLSSSCSVLHSVSTEHFLHCVSTTELLRKLGACLDQSLDSGRVLHFVAPPTVLRTVHRPAQWSSFEVGIDLFQRWSETQDHLCHFHISVK